MSRAVLGPSSGSIRNGPGPTPQWPSVCPKSSSCFSRPEAAGDVEEAEDAHGAVDEDAADVGCRARHLELQQVVDRRGDVAEVAEEVGDATAHRRRHDCAVALGDRLGDRLVHGIVELKTLRLIGSSGSRGSCAVAQPVHRTMKASEIQASAVWPYAALMGVLVGSRDYSNGPRRPFLEWCRLQTPPGWFSMLRATASPLSRALSDEGRGRIAPYFSRVSARTSLLAPRPLPRASSLGRARASRLAPRLGPIISAEPQPSQRCADERPHRSQAVPRATQGREAVPRAVLCRRRLDRRRQQADDPGHQSRDRRRDRQHPEDGRGGDAPRHRGGRPRAAGVARQASRRSARRSCASGSS